MKIQLLLTGNEIMAGDVTDSNSSMIAQKLGAHGFDICRRVTIGDDVDQLIEEIRAISAQSDVLIINGGLGPTVDDLTADALAKAAGLPLQENAEAMAHLQDWVDRLGMTLNAANRKQAILPQGVTIVPNPTGTAVGFSLMLNDCLVICTPGVPSELRRMLDDTIVSTVLALEPDRQPLITTRLKVFGMGESALQQLISDTFPDWPDHIELGFRASLPALELKLTTRHRDHESDRLLWIDKILDLLGDYVIGRNETSIPESVLQLLISQNKTLTLAESCTGGLIASQLTAIAGSSQAFEAGFVTYSNAIKEQVLGVPAAILQQHGAVSEEVVLAMAKGALRVSGADLAIAVSGIAGPDGGSEEKPVGTVWLAWGSTDNLQTKQLFFGKNRYFFQQLVAATGLDLIRRQLSGISKPPRYFNDRVLRRK